MAVHARSNAAELQIETFLGVKNRQTSIIPTSGDANPGVPSGRRPLSVNSSGRVLAESKSASLAHVYSSQRRTFFAVNKEEKSVDRSTKDGWYIIHKMLHKPKVLFTYISCKPNGTFYLQ